MKKILKIVFILFIFFIITCFTINKFTGFDLFNYVVWYTSSDYNNYGDLFLDTVYSSFTYNDIFYNADSYKIGDLISFSTDPVVYIYNTHQKEEYIDSKSVYDGSLYLKDRLEALGVNTIVEDHDIIGILKSRGLDYPYTYSITKEFAKENINNYPSIKVIIDFHRDSIPKESSVTTIGDKSYAKMMFLIGTDNERFKKNEANMQILKDYIDSNYPGIMRNTYYGEDLYNQDVSSYAFSIEIGGNYNTFDEVKNSLEILALAIKSFI